MTFVRRFRFSSFRVNPRLSPTDPDVLELDYEVHATGNGLEMDYSFGGTPDAAQFTRFFSQLSWFKKDPSRINTWCMQAVPASRDGRICFDDPPPPVRTVLRKLEAKQITPGLPGAMAVVPTIASSLDHAVVVPQHTEETPPRATPSSTPIELAFDELYRQFEMKRQERGQQTRELPITMSSSSWRPMDDDDADLKLAIDRSLREVGELNVRRAVLGAELDQISLEQHKAEERVLELKRKHEEEKKDDTTKRQKSDSIASNGKCAICLDENVKLLTFSPCGHTCLCTGCEGKFKKQFSRCPICKTLYKDIIIVYLSTK